MSNQVVLELRPSRTNARNSEGTFVTLTSGRILFAWSKFTGTDNSDFGTGVIATRHSDDGGRTWSAQERILVQNEGTTNVMCPSLLRLQDGRVLLLYLRKHGTRICLPYVRFSRDEGASFSRPIRVIEEPGYYVVNGDRLVQLHNGRILIPVNFCRYRGPSELIQEQEFLANPNPKPQKSKPFMAAGGIIFFCLSDDGGRTWLESLTSFSHCLPTGHGLEEPGVVERRDGSLWCFCRSGMMGLGGCGGRQWQSFSQDQGQVWSPPEPSAFVSPCSPMQVKRIPATGDLLAIWNDQSGRFRLPKPRASSWGRTPLACAISRNEGRTWRCHRLLEKDPSQGFCYPAIHFTDDAVLFAYNFGGRNGTNPLDGQRVRRVTLRNLYG